VLFICVYVLTKLIVGLAEEVTKLQTKNMRMAKECARLAAENTWLAEDHTWFRDHSVKMTEEVKTKCQEITSEWPFS
jgi:predicted Holliday junction resolvase-like endonuclease